MTVFVYGFLLSLSDDSENQSSSHITTLLKNFTIPGFHNELEGNDEQPKIISQLRQYISNLKHLEKKVSVNEKTSKIMLLCSRVPSIRLRLWNKFKT